MRILITSIVDLKRVTHNRIHVFVDYLSRRHDVTVLCLNAWWLEEGKASGRSAHYHKDAYFQEMFERTRILYLSHSKSPPALQEFTSLRTLHSLLCEVNYTSFDVHINYCDLVPGYLVARKAKRSGIPTLFDIADDLPRRMGSSPQVPPFLRGPARFVADLMLDANVKLAKKVTFVTQALKDAYHFPDDKSLLIPNGVNPSLLNSHSSRALRKDLGIDGYFVIGFIGVLLPRVDLNSMLVAMQSISTKLPSVRMLIVGGGDKLPEAEELARRYGISDKVIFAGQVPFGQVPTYISCMDVCLISIADSADCQHAFPLKLLEYMACEKPVVSTPLAGVRETVGDRVLYASNSKELEDRILKLYHDREFGKKLGLQGRSFVEQNYAWSKICARFEDVLLEMQIE